MNYCAILHIPKSSYGYAYRIDELHIRIRTAKDDVDEVSIIYGVKYTFDSLTTKKMTKVSSDKLFDYYEYRIKQSDTRIGYYFMLTKGDEVHYYSEAGFFSKDTIKLMGDRYFQYPVVNDIDLHREPKWVNEAVFYQIFPDRFRRAESSAVTPTPLTPWGEKPKGDSFYGGNLQGIIDSIDYLKELGVNGFYITPIFKSPSNHKYNTADYLEIDEHFGDKKLFLELVQKAHANGIKVILDAVYNHCGVDFAPFKDVLQNGESSRYKDWFYIDSFPVTPSNPNYKTFGFYGDMPRLNTANSEVLDYLIGAATYWIKEFDIDGWRLDVADEVDHTFWREFRKAVKAVKPEALIIGENWHDCSPWLNGDQFDSAMNYPVTNAAGDYFAKRVIDATEFEQRLSGAIMRNTAQVNFSMLNLLDSHDTPRFLTQCNEDISLLRNAVLFIMSYVGIPCTYYGTEIGMVGDGDPDCRRTFNWDRDSWDMGLYEYYKKLIQIRKTTDPLKYGETYMYSRNDLFILRRSYNDQNVWVVINNTDKALTLDLNNLGADKTLTELITGHQMDTKNLTVELKSGLILM